MRSKGYYWVRFRDGGWEPANWDGEDWQVIGISDVYRDHEIPEIGPPVEQPNELSILKTQAAK